LCGAVVLTLLLDWPPAARTCTFPETVTTCIANQARGTPSAPATDHTPAGLRLSTDDLADVTHRLNMLRARLEQFDYPALEAFDPAPFFPLEEGADGGSGR